jgi:hypothetical protein
MITLQALGRAAYLDGRVTRQDEVYNTATGSGAIFASLVRGANSVYHTGLYMPAVVPSGPSLVDLSLGGQTVLEALSELHERSNWEWWVEHYVSSSRIDSIIRWGDEQGEDYRAGVHLYEGQHFAEFVYGIDLAQLKSSVSGIGGVGAIDSRTSSTQSANIATQSAAVLADERVRRSVLSFNVPYTERILLDPTTESSPELTRRIQRTHARALASAEQFAISINDRADWSKLWLGNYITLHARTTLAGFIARVVRIVGVQPSREEGIVILSVETVL